MLEEIVPQKTPLLILVKIISIIVTLSLILCVIVAFLPKQYNYTTAEDLEASNIYPMLFSAAKNLIYTIQTQHQNKIYMLDLKFNPISFIYSPGINGDILYIKFRYTVNNNEYVKYYESSISSMGILSINSIVIEENEYENQKPILPIYETNFDDLSTNLLFKLVLDEYTSYDLTYENILYALTKNRDLLIMQDAKIVSIRFKSLPLYYADGANTLMKISYSVQEGEETVIKDWYFFVNEYTSPIINNGKIQSVLKTNLHYINEYYYNNNYNDFADFPREESYNTLFIDYITEEVMKGEEI